MTFGRSHAEGQPQCSRRFVTLVIGLLGLSTVTFPAYADPPAREAKLIWDSSAHNRLLVSVGFRDVVDGEIQSKLTRGLPTTILFTATLHRVGVEQPLATTAQSCKITWHVWEEAYRLEVTRPLGSHTPTWTPTTEGVLRRCAEVTKLVAATGAQVPSGAALYLRARVQVNPVGEDVLLKIKRWVSRPMGTGTAAPGDALFSTFTGLFLQRIGEAERVLVFTTRPIVPTTPAEE